MMDCFSSENLAPAASCATIDDADEAYNAVNYTVVCSAPPFSAVSSDMRDRFCFFTF